MKFYCFGYYDEKKWATLSEDERNAFMDECFAYDDKLRKGGHVAGGDGLTGYDQARTVRWKGGKAVASEGASVPSNETLGGILVLEARNLDEAVRLVSSHPGIRNGPFVIRPAEDMSAVIAESAKRRRKHVKAA